MRQRVGAITKCKCDVCGLMQDGFVMTDSIPCKDSTCKGRAWPWSRGPAQSFYGNRRFHGEDGMSVTEGFRPYEVPLARKHITAGTIHDDGRVSFADRADQRKFMQQQANLRNGLIQTLGTDD